MNYESFEIFDDGRFVNHGYVDLNGKPVRKTPYDSPYAYDDYVQWKGDYRKGEQTQVVYSDRMGMWDYEKFKELYQKVFNEMGHYFGNKNPENVEQFLKLFFDREIKLTAIMQGCNKSNGNQYWIFFFEDLS